MVDCKQAFCDNVVAEIVVGVLDLNIEDILSMPCDNMNFLVTHDGHCYNDEQPMAFVGHKFVQIGRGCGCRTQAWVVRQQKSTAVGKHTMKAHVNMVMNV